MEQSLSVLDLINPELQSLLNGEPLVNVPDNRHANSLECVYRIYCKQTGKFYIGSTINLQERSNLHWQKLKHNCSAKRLQRHFNEVGLEQAYLIILDYDPAKEVEYCLRLKPSLNTRVDGQSRGKHVIHDLPNAYKPDWRTKTDKSSYAGHNMKPVIAFGNRFSCASALADALEVPVQSICRWCKDDRYKDFYYEMPND